MTFHSDNESGKDILENNIHRIAEKEKEVSKESSIHGHVQGVRIGFELELKPRGISCNFFFLKNNDMKKDNEKTL
jgi:6-pyruvoyl-tetrahydropterin synthase